jgi:hypothetical protein
LRRVPGNRPAVTRDWFRGVPERYVAGADIRGRPGGRPNTGSQQAINKTSGLVEQNLLLLSEARPFVKEKEIWMVYFTDSEKIFARMFFCLMVEVTFMGFNIDDKVILSQ